MFVLDSSAFIREYHTDERTATIPLVREELQDESAYRFDAMEGSGMHVHIPGQGTVETVERAARDLGDLAELSDTDVRLVAAAFELDGTLVTDDYAMQNVADRLGVTVEVIAHDGIEEQREFDDDRDRCPICGSGLSRKNPSNA